MTEEQKQAAIVELKKVPKQVQMAGLLAFALGLVTLARMPLAAYAAHLAVWKAALSGGIMLFWFFLAGGSLYNRNRWGYLGLAVLSLLPFLGVLGLTLLLMQSAWEGTLAASWPETIHCLAASIQLVLSVILFRYLFAPTVIKFIWKPAA